ncbi:transketolase [Martelella alba]|uniref:Transketolase n=1 Tax=Martelella alba TaxID=2590451 RepID=A0A506TZD3_9HYPH|nr:transketolase [Martelella alba]TPW26860.1 transketolase [Martelella alba]
MLNRNVSSVSTAELANAVRALTMDAVQRANSGHPGMPMGMAEIGVALWTRHLRHNPKNPRWFNRDRFVLSNGHGSMLIYSMLHLSGYDLSMDDIRNFRQLHSKTPGHPEYGYTPGVETTTGPLGQGIANAVGMALAEKILAESFNKPGHDLVDHFTYTFVGDGCLMEGVSHEACSLAGTLGLGKLIVLYDDNGISIDGHVEGWFAEDTAARFAAYGWHVIRDVDGHDVAAVDRAIAAGKAETGRPTFICCKTTIGKGSPSKAGSEDSHGNPLGEEEIIRSKAAIGWPYGPFEIPETAYEGWSAVEDGKALEAEWDEIFAAYRAAYPAEAAEFVRRMSGELPDGFDARMAEFTDQMAAVREAMPTRRASLKTVEMLADNLPELVGGSADLASSCLTMWDDAKPVTAQTGGNFVYFGVREFGMGAIMNGMFLHGGFRPFGGTYVMFSEYARNAIRMAALMKIGVIYALTHDSIALGEDGPTHQPIEQLASLRLMPNLDVWRPCDAAETAIAWEFAIANRNHPTVMALSRQSLPQQVHPQGQSDLIRRGGYILSEASGRKPDAVVIATGGEVEIAMAAKQQLAGSGINVRVVSLPSSYVFDRQPEEYRSSVIPEGLPLISVEAGVTDYWRKYIGPHGIAVGIDTFGESAPSEVLFEHFKLTPASVASAVQKAIARGKR